MKPISINLLPGDKGRTKRKKVEFILFSFGIFFLSFLASIFLNNFIAYQVKKCEVYKDQLIEKVSAVSSAIKKLKQQPDQLDPML
ncbi:MAG: hypothetical protein O7C59_00290 [Rickettsia endosymbiont of Ixodes persulcatus]|nr:hypothetical protein [Rickettsia endosymbiont of Ixodes persulcatus]